MNSDVGGPDGVATPATITGAVMVDSTYLSTGTASWVDQSCFSLPTFLGVSVVSARFQPVRSWS